MPIWLSPYHPLADRLVERFNRTLKAMLRRAAVEDRKDWDRLLPYLLFAYREVPQSSTGFSPFELLYGRQVHVHGPLDILRESWEAKSRSTESVVSYVLVMRERLSKMTELVQQNLAKAQTQQKTWYDKKARARKFEAGEEVLVLLPTSANKLLAQWQGPYKILRRIGGVNYKVDMVDKKKRKRILHVKLLQKWHVPVQGSYFAEDDNGSDSNGNMLEWGNRAGDQEEQPPFIGEQLDPEKRTELEDIISGFSSVP